MKKTKSSKKFLVGLPNGDFYASIGPSGLELEKVGGDEKMQDQKYDYVSTDNKNINNPSHYTYGNIEVIDMIESAGWLPQFCAGNAIKYIMRHEHKGKTIEDLEKASWYLNRLIDYYKTKQSKEGEVTE